MIRKLATLVLAMLMLGIVGCGQQPVTAKVIISGSFHGEETGLDLPAYRTAAGRIVEIDGKTFSVIAQTNRIPATVGTCFGFCYTLEGAPQGTIIGTTIEFSHPPMKNPVYGDSMTNSICTLPVIVGNINSCTYVFLDEWEAVVGTWEMSVYQKDRLLAKRKFELYKP